MRVRCAARGAAEWGGVVAQACGWAVEVPPLSFLPAFVLLPPRTVPNSSRAKGWFVGGGLVLQQEV